MSLFISIYKEKDVSQRDGKNHMQCYIFFLNYLAPPYLFQRIGQTNQLIVFNFLYPYAVVSDIELIQEVPRFRLTEEVAYLQ